VKADSAEAGVSDGRPVLIQCISVRTSFFLAILKKSAGNMSIGQLISTIYNKHVVHCFTR
jgi:hypothetical protein